MNKFDAVIVGGGHNGLTCGAYLARAGWSVCVLERRGLLGGAAVSEAVWPGYKVSTASYTMALLQPRIILDLELARYGYEVLTPPPMFAPLEGGKSLIFGDEASVSAQLRVWSADDAEAYPRYRAHMRGLAKVVQRFLWETPPDPTRHGATARLALASLIWRLRDIGDQFFDIYDVLTLSAHDYLSRWFRSDAALAAIGFYAAAGGGNTSMKSAGSAYVLLRAFIRDNDTPAGGSGFIRGGMGSISEAIAASGRAHGMQTRVDAKVRNILIEQGRAAGVRLASGERIDAGVVIANASAKTVFRELVDPGALPPEFLQDIDRIRDRGTSYKVHLGLRRLPTFKEFDPAMAGFPYPAQVRIGPSVDYIERAFDGSKYGEFSEQPCLTVITPSVLDDTVAPPGKHLMSIFGAHAPYTLRNRAWSEAREDLYEATIRTLERHAPDIRDCIEERQILTPVDYEVIFGLHGGHLHHGELSADQIFFRRPVRHYADYGSPVPGLYQCGASTHPGGGVTGIPGHNAAQVVLKQHRHGPGRTGVKAAGANAAEGKAAEGKAGGTEP
jgi:phytoene dehydrogenase-like protein